MRVESIDEEKTEAHFADDGALTPVFKNLATELHPPTKIF